MHDIVRWARDQKPPILCQGRGSSANSAVCYCLGITVVDPGQEQAAVRAVPVQGTQRTAGHRRRFRARTPRGSHPVCLPQIRPRPRRARGDRHQLSQQECRARCRTRARPARRPARSPDRHVLARAQRTTAGGMARANAASIPPAASCASSMRSPRRSTVSRAISRSTSAAS